MWKVKNVRKQEVGMKAQMITSTEKVSLRRVRRIYKAVTKDSWLVPVERRNRVQKAARNGKTRRVAPITSTATRHAALTISYSWQEKSIHDQNLRQKNNNTFEEKGVDRVYNKPFKGRTECSLIGTFRGTRVTYTSRCKRPQGLRLSEFAKEVLLSPQGSGDILIPQVAKEPQCRWTGTARERKWGNCLHYVGSTNRLTSSNIRSFNWAIGMSSSSDSK